MVDPQAKMEATDAARRLASYAVTVVPGAEVYLFGSYADGRATPGSDIDVAVLVESFPEGNTPAGAWAVEEAVWRRAMEIDDRLEPTIRTKGDRSGIVQIARRGLRLA